ncbi:MAG: arylamine N-acetyltransferase [Firmicutes bacterium]|nr:arylamine N-acetyltransferase [Bacillota bacterium]
MSNEAFNLDAYFKRIKYEGPTDVSFETLKALHTAHTLNIPFENLDVYLRKPILIDCETLFNKLVTNKRGGYCFEMNGLFSCVLEAMGFNVKTLLTKGRRRDGRDFAARTHQVLLVEIDGQKYLADVGFGNNGLTSPILLETDLEQQQLTHTFRLVSDPDHSYRLQYKVDGEYTPLFAFTLDACTLADCQMSNHYTATYPESLFRKIRMCTMPTLEGRVTLNEMTFKILANGELTETLLANEEEYKQVLKQYFNLDLDTIQLENAPTEE